MKKLTFIVFAVLINSSVCFAQTNGALTFYSANYSGILKTTNYGKIITRGTPAVPSLIAGMTSSDYVHIFIDENGNLISTNLPNAVPWVNYVIHVIHPIVTGESFGVVQTSGSISGSFTIQNAPAPPAPGPGPHPIVAPVYIEDVSSLSPSDNSNIGFQVVKTSVNLAGVVTKSTVGTYTLTMSGFFNASIDIGILNSKLHNPAFTLVNSPDVVGQMVVKSADGGDRTMTTVMGTVYFSPIVWMERVFDKNNVPLFKLKGRSSIEDHKIYERVYPTFGLSINEKAFQNIFYGLNWEIIRGGSLFLGFHTGKINTYNSTNSNFQPGVTQVTQDQFNYAVDTKWATKFAVGATIDLRLVFGLLATQVK